MKRSFQRGAAADLDAVYHFTFTGSEEAKKTVIIRNGTIAILEGLEGKPTLAMVADTATWLGYLAGEKSLLWALLTRRLRLSGHPKWLQAFGRCFPR
jgi:putative sterol carrier protein